MYSIIGVREGLEMVDTMINIVTGLRAGSR